MVTNYRMDILGSGDLIKVLDYKWESYAEKWFNQRLKRAGVCMCV